MHPPGRHSDFLNCSSGQRIRARHGKESSFGSSPSCLAWMRPRSIRRIRPGNRYSYREFRCVLRGTGRSRCTGFKTDRVKTAQELKEKYHAQLDYYAQALTRLTGKRVKEKVIYSIYAQEGDRGMKILEYYLDHYQYFHSDCITVWIRGGQGRRNGASQRNPPAAVACRRISRGARGNAAVPP